MSDDIKKTEEPQGPDTLESHEAAEPSVTAPETERSGIKTQACAVNAACATCCEWAEKLAPFAKLPGAFLNRERGRAELWLLGLFAFLGLLLLINIFARPEHPHFGFDAWWGFWAVFGLVVGVAMVFIMKRVIQPLIVRKEDYYGDL
ncbi:hypothetical protein LJC23_03150 [Desulfovibrio sp. OttesenSCG-928-I05]|nr:hypothetical protein [Desulfovibrio sp. OttesenSCG-928-I05]